MFFGGGSISLVDWDLFARGDPALDVANFAVYLRTRLGGTGVSAAARFLSEYGALNDTVLPRVHLFAALTYVRLVCKAYRLREPGWEVRARLSVQRAEAALDRGAGF
jgi:aminoglycoside phosphotransferase (APT) family kinase protein